MKKRILILEDDESLRFVISKALSRAGYEVRATASAQTALSLIQSDMIDGLVADVLLGTDNFLEYMEDVYRLKPNLPIIVMSAQTTAHTAIKATQKGAFEYLSKPFDLNDLISLLNKALNISARSNSQKHSEYEGLIGRSKAMQSTFRILGRLSQTRFPVLFIGSDGSGRATAARVLHQESSFKTKLVELGPLALERDGVSYLNEGSQVSLLLRRAEDWSLKAQNLVLEALEIDDKAPRIFVTASPIFKDNLPDRLIERMAVGLVELPALRRRGEDKSILFEHFLLKAGGGAFQLSEKAKTYINTYDWPGEVQQLRRTVEHIVAQKERGAIKDIDVIKAIRLPKSDDPHFELAESATRFFNALNASKSENIDDQARLALDSGLIRAALQMNNGIKQDAAKALGINRNTFSRRVEALKASPQN